ncbi:hypothetical protein [Umboniibacter marinipuniceus]|uniref:Scaffold protein FimL second domain-containing protein n=1 Tax=Umboniibacter marinipuniceus TaxID=569599 RepID=A0A3M0AF28_9GAMM|nr:hypothetical protein [Umboniibacter marinipuniceus]RMA81055.1 hypothetical protein DFR27_0847 [Umboniibacter marinipuniceus]
MPQNFQIASLVLVKEQMLATLHGAANHLDEWIEDDSLSESLEQAMNDLSQLAGTAKILSLDGLATFYGVAHTALANGSISAATEIKKADYATLILKTERYLDFLEEGGLAAAEVLHADIVKLERLAKEKPSDIFQWRDDLLNAVELKDYRYDDAALRRFRTMFQTGLLALLSDEPGRAVLLMDRAAQRLRKGAIDADELLWQLASQLISTYDTATVPMDAKRQLSYLDRYLAARIKGNGELNAYNRALGAVCWSSSVQRASGVSLESYPYSAVAEFSWAELTTARSKLDGIAADTLSSVAELVKEDLRQSRELLELMSSDNQSRDNARIDQLVGQFKSVANTLEVISLGSLAVLLRNQAHSLVEASANTSLTDKLLEDTADCLLYVESCLQTINSADAESLDVFNDERRKSIIADNLFQSARELALNEAKVMVGALKISLNEFVESGFDVSVVNEAASQLNCIAGIMNALNLARPLSVVQSAQSFVSEKVLSDHLDGAIEPMLETFADALIGLEYYLDRVSFDENTDEGILDMASESLKAVGY